MRGIRNGNVAHSRHQRTTSPERFLELRHHLSHPTPNIAAIPLLPGAAISQFMESAMFKLIGGAVVYGFALLGLATYLEKLHGGR